MTSIADKVRGVQSEKRATQEQMAAVLGITRQSVSLRMGGKVAWGAHELFRLSVAWGAPITRFYPDVRPDSGDAA